MLILEQCNTGPVELWAAVVVGVIVVRAELIATVTRLVTVVGAVVETVVVCELVAGAVV